MSDKTRQEEEEWFRYKMPESLPPLRRIYLSVTEGGMKDRYFYLLGYEVHTLYGDVQNFSLKWALSRYRVLSLRFPHGAVDLHT